MTETCSAADDAPGKQTLFCTECEHRSPVDEDWRVVETDGAERYLCPECGTTVTVRPQFDRDADRGPTPNLVEPWTQGVRAWLAAWRTASGTS